MNFFELRKKYPKFIYKNYEILNLKDKLIIKYNFEITNLSNFNPSIEIYKKDFNFNSLNSKIVKNIIFNIGMIEAISYYKLTCSPQFLVKCGNIDDFQKEWFKKLFYLGLGEFRYINNINISLNEFVKFVVQNDVRENTYIKEEIISKNKFDGIIIPVGGGKDSNVTLDLLKEYKNKSLAFCIGSKDVSINCAKTAGYKENEIIEIKRNIDKKMIELNSKGFLNGHTPFSAIVAFISYLMAYLLGKKYIVLSNENSANETNITGENINHQYSKTIEFENDFREYVAKYFDPDIEYFSILRPINELQIAMLFSKLEKYHSIFKSCNVGSKLEPWKWCCSCPKCLFVYIILSPFLYKDKLVEIFGEDLFEKEELLQTFIELCGYGKNKPFECVGTYKEIRFAISKTIKNIEEKNMPFLLKYYKDNFKITEEENLLKNYNTNNNLPKEFEIILKNRINNL